MPYIFPAVKGHQKTTEFFLSTLEAGEIEALVALPEDFLGDDLLDDSLTMQRKLSWTRVRKEMKEYLLNSDNSFYSALTLFIVPRDLTPLVDGEGYEFRPNTPTSRHGELEIRSTCILFPGDGQHRAASIKEALKADSKLAAMQVPVVLIPFKNRNAVRQLFSDLNLNAKPVNRSIALSFETRDPNAIVTKAVINTVELFSDRTNRRSNSLPETSGDVITVNALYQANSELADALGMNLDDLRSKDETDPTVVEAAETLAEVWKVIISSLDAKANGAWSKVMAEKKAAGDVRKEYVFAFAIGWQAIAQAAAAIIKERPETWKKDVAKALGKVDWTRTNADWQGVAMVGDRVNNTGPGIRATAGYIIKSSGFQGDAMKPLLTALESSLLKAKPQKKSA